MIKCVPVPTTDPNGRLNVAFDVTLINVDENIYNIHTTYGGGACFQGKEIGRASLILKRGNTLKTKNNLEVVFLSGYRNDGKDFCVETENSVIEACTIAARAFWV